MPREVREVTAKTALQAVHHMPFQWSLNPYRGCQHGCVYCYARATHRFLDLDAGDDFSQVLFAKVNLPSVLDRELRRRRVPPDLVAVGTATDPYQPIEGRYRLTRECLTVLDRRRIPTQIITKGTLVRRDVDVLRRMTQGAGVTVMFSVPTVDDALARQTEPGTPPPRLRLAAMKGLAAEGIRVGVLMAPILPGLSDDGPHLNSALAAARAHGAQFVHADLVRLAPEVRPVFFAYLRRHHPELLRSYQEWFLGAVGAAPPEMRRALLRVVPPQNLRATARAVTPWGRTRQTTFDF